MAREKLIRHRVPVRAAENGVVLKTRAAGPDERMALLADKLLEEAAEFLAEPGADELADLQEVLNAIRNELGPEKCNEVAARKYFERGGFYQGVVLILED